MDSREGDYVNAVGLDSTAIAKLSYAKVHELRGSKGISWDILAHDIRARWVATIDVMFAMCERRVEASAKDLTSKFVDSIAGPDTFERMPPLTKILWEAVLRFTLNLITAGSADSGEIISQHDIQMEFDEALSRDWMEWISEKAQKLNLVKG